MDEVKDPVKTFYLLGYNDANQAGRKRMRSVGVMYKLSYVCGWWDAKMKRENRYADK